MKRPILSGVSVGVLVAFMILRTTPAQATTLPPGSTVTSISTESGTFFTQNSTGSLSFNFAGNTGHVEEWVGTFSSNPFGASALTFLYQFTVSSGVVQDLSAQSFTNFLIDVGDNSCGFCLADPGTNGPASANRTADGSVIEFTFSPEVTAGGSSYVLIINTDATVYGAGSFGLIDGGGETFAGFEPAPEPGTLALFGSGLLGVVGLMRRKLLRA